MGAFINLLCAIVLLSLVGEGLTFDRVAPGECTIDDVKISQSKSGVVVKTKPEWNVTIKNDCICTQSDIKVFCTGFESVEAVNPLVIIKTGDVCVVNNGERIYAHDTLNFLYAWDSPFPFKPLDSQISCS